MRFAAALRAGDPPPLAGVSSSECPGHSPEGRRLSSLITFMLSPTPAMTDKVFQLASSEESVGGGERQRACSIRNRRNFLQVESNDLC